MRKIFTLFVFAIVPLFITATMNAQVMGEGGWRAGEMQIRISAGNPEQFNQLYKLKLNMEYSRLPDDHITVYVTPAELKQIEDLGIQYIVEIEDLNTYFQNFWLVPDQYHTYQQIIELADSLAGAFPSICKKYLYGYSLQNRQCVALKISDNVEIDEPEAEVMFDGGIHGDEIGGPENLIRFARDLCIKYGVDPVVTNLINNREIWLYLMVNPDGRANMSRYNANGVDLNRDWGYMWDQWGGSPAAFSQIETRFLRECMYTNQFVVHTSYHSGTQIISYPWSYRPDATPDQNHIHQLAGIYSSVSGYSSLPYGQGYHVMYPINGSTKDGNYGMMGSVSWSIEISNSKQPPASQIMQFYNWNYPSMIALIEYSGYGLEGIVTDITNGFPVAATVFVNNYFPTYNDPTVGDYHKYVLPGTYSITVKASGYQSQTINNVVVTAGSSTVTNFQLQPGGGYYVYKFAASQIPNNNFSDEGLTSAVIGPPDNINYSIGKNGWCVLDMQYPVLNTTGPDIVVYEGDATPEGFYCYAGQSVDGPWVLLGFGTGTTQFDLSTGGLSQAQFIKILDDGDGTAVEPDAGFDLDAIQAYDIIPVELISFTATVERNSVSLTWQTATETNNRGFEIERAPSKSPPKGETSGEWKVIGFVEGRGTTTEMSDYTFKDKITTPGSYVYRLKQIDFDGSFSYSKEIEVEVSGPTNYALYQNYPNPFNPATTIKYALPVDSRVKINVYNSLGQLVETVVDKEMESGYHEVNFNASRLSSGVYLYQLQAGEYVSVKKMMLMK
jgi:hypothetical protein